MKFDENIDLSVIDKNIVYASSELNGIYIFVCLEREDSNYYLINEILYFVIEKFLFNFKYSKDNIFELVNVVNNYYLEKIIENKEIDITKISFLLIISDYNKISLVNIGHFRFTHIRDNKILNQVFENTVSYHMFKNNEIEIDKVYTSKYYNLLTKSIGDRNLNFEYNIFDLELDDKIIIQSKESIKQTQNIFEILENKVNFNNIYLNAILTLKEKNEKSLYKEEFKITFRWIITLLLSMFIFLGFINYFYIGFKINDLKISINEYKKLEYNIKNKENLNNIILNYKFINKNYYLIYISFKLNEFNKIKEEIDTLKIEYDKLLNLVKEIENIDSNIKNNLDKDKLEVIKNNLSNNYLTNILKINEDIIKLEKKIDKYIYLKLQEEKIDKLYNENNYEQVFNIYNELLKEYENLKDNESIEKLNYKILSVKEKFYNLYEKIEKLESEYGKYKNIDIDKALNILQELKNYYMILNNSDKLKEIENHIYNMEKEKNDILDNINYLEKVIDKNIKLENYKNVLNEINNILNLLKVLNLNNKIKYYKSLFLDIKNKKINKENTERNLKKLEEISNNNKKNYELAKQYEKKADNYLKNNEIESAYNYYLKAVELIKNDNSVKQYYDKLIKKIEYIRKK